MAQLPPPPTPSLPRGFLTPSQFHEGQTRLLTSRKRITAVTAGQGGGKTSAWYWRLYALMAAFPNESHFVGFPSYILLERVIMNPVDADRYSLMQFLDAVGEEPIAHKMDRWIQCKSGQILFASAENLINWEGSHVISVTIDEFDECPVGAFRRAMERTRLKRGYVTLAGTPRNVKWVKQELMHRDSAGVWLPNDDVEMIKFPSTANPMYSEEAMREAQKYMAGFEFRRMHLGELAEAEGGNLFRREYWQSYIDIPDMEHVVQFWDTAFKATTSADYSVCATWGKAKGKLYLLDLYRGKLEWPELVRQAEKLYSIWNPVSVRIEDKASGQSLIQELRTKGMPTIPVKTDQDKWRRASSVVGLVEAGLCHLPEGALWVGDFIEEHAQFSPSAKDYAHDDQVDTTSMALDYFKRGIQGTRQIVRGERKASAWTPGNAGGSIMGSHKQSIWQ